MDIRAACLGVLTRGDATGYEIKKFFEDGPFGYFFDAGFGSIYPALARLCREGLATVEVLDEPGRPTRKSYSITPSGRATFEQILLDSPGEDRLRSEWVFVAYFAELLPPEVLERRIQQRLDWYRARLAGMRECDPESTSAGERFVLDLGKTVYEAAARYMEEAGPRLVDARRNLALSTKAAE